MDQTQDILEALKRCLRAKGISYRQVATALELSEARVKRLFSEGSFSIRRLELVCRMMDMSLFDLTRLTRMRDAAQSRVLTLKQERALADDPPLLQCLHGLLNGWTASQIKREYELSEAQLVKLLSTLDRLRLIELQPRNRVRLLTARNIDWRQGGPVRALYEQQMRRLFLSGEVGTNGECFNFAAGELSQASMHIMRRRIERLARDFEELVELDMNLPLEERENSGLMVAFRPWRMRLMDDTQPAT